jgi:ABC-type Fe3+-citrate transport system substrate-binding protein
MSKVQERLDKHDKQIAAIRDLLKEGMRLMVETRKDLRTIAAMQKRTDASLKAFIDALRRND